MSYDSFLTLLPLHRHISQIWKWSNSKSLKTKKYVKNYARFTTLKNNSLLKTNLNRANGLLAKIRHLVSKSLLRTIYFAIFDSHLRYGCQIWGQKDSQEFKSITTVQNKGHWILNFKGPLEHSRLLYKSSKMLKLIDLIKLNNILFVYDQINNNLPNTFENYFQLKRQQHNHFTRGKILNVPQVNTSLYGSSLINLSAIRDWNALHGQSGLELIISLQYPEVKWQA